MKTIRLLYPDYVSGSLETYFFWANLLTHILPKNKNDTYKFQNPNITFSILQQKNYQCFIFSEEHNTTSNGESNKNVFREKTILYSEYITVYFFSCKSMSSNKGYTQCDKEVEFEGRNWKLSPLTKELYTRKGTANASGAYQGARYWKYDDILLADIM